MKISFTDYGSGMRYPEIRKMTMTSQFADMTLSSNFFWRCFDSLVKFSCCFKLHVNIIAGSGVMTIFFYKRLNRNPEIRNTPVWVSPIIWKPGELGIPNLARMFLIKCSYMMQNAKVTAFTVIAILRENLQGYQPPTRLSTLSAKLSANKTFTQIFFRYKII